MFIYTLPLCYNGDIMVFREISGRRDIIDEEIERYENEAYLNGLQDARDAMILMIQKIEEELPEKVKDALYEFISYLSTDIQQYRYLLLKEKLFETIGWIDKYPGSGEDKEKNQLIRQ